MKLQLLADIEDHLNITIQQVEPDMKIESNQFDGKVVYGQKRKHAGCDYENHTAQMAPTVNELSKLECEAQLLYIKRHFSNSRK